MKHTHHYVLVCSICQETLYVKPNPEAVKELVEAAQHVITEAAGDSIDEQQNSIILLQSALEKVKQ